MLLKIRTVLFCFFFAVFAAPLSLAQTSGGGTVQGTVKDSTEALIPGAKVIIRHLATGRVSGSVTNSEGFFVSPSLAIGKYKVRVEAQGMKAWESEVTVETARTSEISPVLTLGEVSETIVISGNVTPLVTTTDPTDGSTLDSQRIQELPLNGRNLNKLLEDVTPGVETIVDVNGGVRVSGLMVYSTDYIQDGAASNNREFGGSGNLQGLESIAEVKVETSTSSAKYNRPTSVIVTTKGGSNRIHGALFETHRNNAFGVARARQDVLPGGDYSVPKLIRNEFGGTISGPVFLPTFGLNGKSWYNGKNRTFFLVSREGLRLRQGLTRDFRVPTAAMRDGDFSGVVDSLNRKLIIYDPLTGRDVQISETRKQHLRDPFPDNKIPISRISPLAKFVFGITPLPNDITNPLISTNLKMPVPTNGFPNTDDNPTTVRIDHVISQKDNFFIKANGGKRPAYFLGTAGNNGAPTLNNEANVTYLTFESIAGSASWTHVFSPTFSVETLVNRSWINSTTVTGPEFIDYPKQLGLPNPYGEIGWPNLVNLGLTNYTYIEGDNRRALYSIVTNAEQNYTWVKKTHNIQFGGRFHHERQHLLPDQGAISGTANFNSLATALHSPTLGTATNPQAVPQTGFDVANFFLGHAARYDVGLKRGIMRVSEKNYGFYFQDNWKVNNRLTLTPGVRWDMNPAFTEKSSALNVFDLNSHALVFPEPLEHYYQNGTTTPKIVSLYQNVGVKFLSAEQAGLPKKIFKDNWFDIGPRAGFAYRMFDGNRQMVIRGGYGMYLSAVPMRTLLAQFSSLVPFRATFVHNPNSAAQSPDEISNYLLRTVPAVIAGSNSANVIDLNNPSAIGRGVAVRGMDGKQSSVKIHEWNLTIEKQLARSTVFRISYKGKHGVNTDQLYEVNPQATDYIYYTTTGEPLPTGQFASVARRVYDREAYTEVRILQRSGYINTAVWSFEVERRFSKGLGFQAFYTLTNSLRLAGNSFRDDVVGRPEVYLPGTVPTDIKEFNRFLFYDRDTAVPKHRVRWNWNYDLPFGKGRSFGRNASGFLNGVIGGWKLSGSGTMLNTWYAMPTGQWGEFGNFEVYGKKHKILDCRATPTAAADPSLERCTPGYLWHNGYISQAVINRTNAAGLKTGVFGLPDNYKPAQKPLWPAPPTGAPLPEGYRSVSDYDTNVAYVRLNSGSEVRVNYDTGLHPWRNQYFLGPFNWVTDASMLKFFRVTEKVRVRVNLDVFNIFNRQGFNAPSA
ncbi:MAG: TonB-dependent receptor domain-containing protein, partial [Blastocatellia bacterium]